MAKAPQPLPPKEKRPVVYPPPPPPDGSPSVSQVTSETIPQLTRETILHVDATPNAEYPIRILRAYRDNAATFWKCQGMAEATVAIYQQMNRDQLDRVRILDHAIALLELSGPVDVERLRELETEALE